MLGTTVVDLIGNVTRIRFRDIETGIDPPPETFAFTPPAGASVIEVPSDAGAER